MKSIVKLLILNFLLMFAAAGCVSSLNPLYTDRDLIFDAALLGDWTDKDSKETWSFSPAGGKEYKLVYTDEDGRKGEFSARLLKIEGERFLDLTPVKTQSAQNGFYQGHFLPTHTFVKISQAAGGKGEISHLEPKWLKTYLAQNPGAVRHEQVSGEIILTASTKELQKFVTAHLKTEGAFAEPVSIRRREGGQ